ncbi:MAG: C4-dicarboxylate ABC transporter [Hyphomicrobiales bacterium]|nr:MAG: C4-dicarboxylate ABC transporter [Hyphomicrobiales bacterium]
MNYGFIAGAVSALLVSSALVTPAVADEVKLPSTIAWTAYNTGTTGYNQSVAIGKALKDKYGVSLRVVPGKNDISRLTPLRTGKVQFVANGGATYFASEGVSLFAAREWGPMKLRLLMSATSNANLQVGTAKDANIKTYADLKGKRVAYVIGSDALNIGTEAILAFGGLTWDDVTKVEFPGYGASWKGLLNNQVDAAFASTVSGPTRKLEASPRGIYWPAMPASDAEGWARLSKVAPYIIPHTATDGSGNISKETPVEGAGYPYPILITLAKQDPVLVYSMTKSIHVTYPDFENAMPALIGWSLERQSFQWAVPYHEAAIKYWKEIGAWTGEMQKHNDGLIARQDVLAAAWATMEAKNISDDDAYKVEWIKVRKAALTKAGMTL